MQSYGLMNKQLRGFTIVELLIVIVIIGILAGLVISTFTGIQARARNTSRINSVQKTKKLLMAYTAQYDFATIQAAVQPPSGGSAVSVCIGNGYQNVLSSGTGCSQSTFGNAQSSTALDALLKPLGNYNMGFPVLNTSGLAQSSPVLSVYPPDTPTRLDGQPFLGEIVYMLEGNNLDCVLRPVITAVDATNYITTSSQKNSGYGSGVTRCSIPFSGT